MNDATQATIPPRPASKQAQSVPLSLSIDQGSMVRFFDLIRDALEPMIAKALSEVKDVQNPPAQATEPTPPNASAARGVDLKPIDQLKAADLRVAFLLGKIPEDSGLLVDAKTFASLLSISTATLYRLQGEEAIPAAVQLGHLKKWRLAEILEWIEADCPPQRVWGQKRQDSSKKKGK